MEYFVVISLSLTAGLLVYYFRAFKFYKSSCERFEKEIIRLTEKVKEESKKIDEKYDLRTV